MCGFLRISDASRQVRKDSRPANFAVLRQIALNLLKPETTVKASLKAKRLRAGWDKTSLLKVIFGQGN